MTVYTLINPSDPYHLTADDLVVAAVAVCLLGHGKYALDARDGTQGMPLFVFGGHDEWFKAQSGSDFTTTLDSVIEGRAQELIAVLESVTLEVPERSSTNNIGGRAESLAQTLRERMEASHA